ncbi:tRNA (adenosine(37)-N6)-threonylcarbamoyltransferase complex transferase subunit TsaD [Syntrophorhabdus aromaticivorans]|jgi:N6-L-threonylcarbamoyladenine synthase|uniref:tRNA N6-adenosine threonylcarbamoyltransferase n=1 Tax=Syntrophorhabdus aromaticivorans TaxID=328301 RepID=A0A971S0J0_9BACT|nr:tRNA (adenosine(37)-N6)-threonylcarbamoyltransferase complex transferase subunit TsaD [Syntrophorhabdus aromaticivorans]NLW35131.1 tRNA (adenosine(37)-N6)-threonylcarbamoyltransferase complex transferase subunit TsaD [Syntrophorhabdus aromaticivorans]
MLVLGIDTSCDDTSLALLQDGKTLLSNVVSSQVDLHRVFGGVVPEIASRKHVELIDGLYRETLKEGGIPESSVDGIGVTAGPGLIGSVLVGLCFAKGLALSLGKPLIAVNHIEAHAMSIFLEREVEFPFIALVVSGGHTIMLLIQGFGRYRVLGSTRDDAAGEAFDKIAKYLGIGYPGGKVIEDLSAKGQGDYVTFPRPMADEKNYDFSFSGLKTSMINYIKKYGVTEDNLSNIMASFQEAAFDVLVSKTTRAALDHGIPRIVVGGGVASNGRLRQVFTERCKKGGMEALFSSPEFCTDNGAMIARVAYQYYSEGATSSLNVAGYSRMKIR